MIVKKHNYEVRCPLPTTAVRQNLGAWRVGFLQLFDGRDSTLNNETVRGGTRPKAASVNLVCALSSPLNAPQSG